MRSPDTCRLVTVAALLIVLASTPRAVAQEPAAAKDAPKELKIGDPAPDFALPASDGKTYKLSDFKGKQAVVVAWFPRAFTRGCTIECASLAANEEKIRKYDVTFFMASVDPVEGERGNKAFAEKQKARFPLLGDADKSVAAAYGVLNARGVSNRWTIYIDKDGKVAAIDKAVKPETAAEDMIAKLADLKSRSGEAPMDRLVSDDEFRETIRRENAREDPAVDNRGGIGLVERWLRPDGTVCAYLEVRYFKGEHEYDYFVRDR